MIEVDGSRQVFLVLSSFSRFYFVRKWTWSRVHPKIEFSLRFIFIHATSPHSTSCIHSRGSQRDVVYLGWPIAHSYMSPKAGAGRGGRLGASANEYSCAHGAQINFGDLTPYFNYVMSVFIVIMSSRYVHLEQSLWPPTSLCWSISPSFLYILYYVNDFHDTHGVQVQSLHTIYSSFDLHNLKPPKLLCVKWTVSQGNFCEALFNLVCIYRFLFCQAKY